MRLYNQVIGLAKALIVDQLRWRTVIIQLPIVAALPIYFVVAFGAWSYLETIMAGAVVSVAVWIATALVQDIVYEKETYKYLEMLIVSPMTPIAYIIGHLLAVYVLSVLSMTPLLVVYAYIVEKPIALLAVPLIALLAIPLSVASMLVGLRMKSIREVAGLSGLVSLLLLFVPPVYYPASRLPGILAKASLLVPSAALAEAYRGLTLGESIVNPSLLILYLLLLTLASLVYALKSLDWRIG